MGFDIRNKPDMKMEKLMSRIHIIMLVLCCVAIIGCGKKQDETKEQTPSAAQAPPPPAPAPNMENQEQAREYIKQQMAQMEARTEVMDAKTAYALALPEAQKWDAQAKLYQIKGEKKLTPDGSAAMWTAYFATRTDPRNTPRREHGKKCTVLMMDGRVMKVSPKETPEDISYSAACHAFLPDDRLNSKEALAKCLAALKDKHGAAADNAELKRLICSSKEFSAAGGSGGEEKPVWELSASINGSSASVIIHAVTGGVMEVN